MTLEELRAALAAERGVRVAYDAAWRFFAAEDISFKEITLRAADLVRHQNWTGELEFPAPCPLRSPTLWREFAGNTVPEGQLGAFFLRPQDRESHETEKQRRSDCHGGGGALGGKSPELWLSLMLDPYCAHGRHARKENVIAMVAISRSPNDKSVVCTVG